MIQESFHLARNTTNSDKLIRPKCYTSPGVKSHNVGPPGIGGQLRRMARAALRSIGLVMNTQPPIWRFDVRVISVQASTVNGKAEVRIGLAAGALSALSEHFSHAEVQI
jgi:hypothetical protein